MLQRLTTREATAADLEAIRAIYNQGIEDRAATLDTDPKSPEDIGSWWNQHDDRYAVLVAEDGGHNVVGWVSLNRFSHRCAHNGIADLSIYVERSHRGHGVGSLLIPLIEARARGAFHKIVLHALNDNAAGKRLYTAAGFREVGVFREHGSLGDKLVDVVAMEKLLA